MSVARAALELSATASDVERLWADPAGWAAFVDGFDRVVELDPAWPAPGARLVWESHPGGRGRVTEKVLRHEPGAELVVELEDPQLRAVQRLAFAPVADPARAAPVTDPARPAGAEVKAGVGVALELDYVLVNRGPFMLLADPLFVRRALRDSLRRTLQGLSHQLAG
jgi:hypothetical protein